MATWLFAIVKNTTSRHRRRESRIREHEVLAPGEGDDTDPLSGRMHPAGHPDAGQRTRARGAQLGIGHRLIVARQARGFFTPAG